MITLLVSTNLVSFAAGLVAGGISCAVLFYAGGYQRGRRDAWTDRSSRIRLRTRLAALVIAPTPLPAARRDHKRHPAIKLVRK